MATMALNIVGAVAGAVGMGMMIPGLIPEKDNHEPIVRIAAGLTSNVEDNTAGNTPGVALFDVMGRIIGSTEGTGDRVNDGAFIDIKVPFNDGVGTKPAEYVAVTDGGNDALCIAYISLTNPDGGKHVWYGDIGKECGHPWYHSMLKTGKIGASEKEGYDYQPACIWIDRDRSNGLPYQGLGMHIYDFEATEERAKMYTKDKNQMCRVAPRYRMYQNMNSNDSIPYFQPPLERVPGSNLELNPEEAFDTSRWAMPDYPGDDITKEAIDGWTDKRSLPVRKRNGPVPTDSTSSGVVIISTSQFHSATELCNSGSSWGHDFVSSTENLFCDMDVKKLWPVCSATQASACFDTKISKMRPAKGLRGRDSSSGAVPPEKNYAKTIHWD